MSGDEDDDFAVGDSDESTRVDRQKSSRSRAATHSQHNAKAGKIHKGHKGVAGGKRIKPLFQGSS